MTMETATIADAGATTSIEDEERVLETTLLASLARLQEMHVALRNLRDTIPRLVSTIQQSASTPHSSPDDLYAHFSSAALGAGSDIKSFAQLMGEASTKDVLERAKIRKEEDAEGIEGWKVVEHEDWMDVKKEADETTEDQEKRDNVPLETTGNGEADSDNDQSAKSEEEVKKTVEKFREEHQGFVCVVGESGKKISVHMPQPKQLKFHATAVMESDTSFKYVVTCEGHNERLGSIQNAFAARPQQANLKFLLEMLSTYTDLYTSKCKKCDRQLDRASQLPVVRTRRRVKQPDGQSKNEWDAFHQSCI